MNKVNLLGTFTKEFEYSHSTKNIDFYKSTLSIKRFSGITDYITIITSKPLNGITNKRWYIDGNLRVFNQRGHSYYYVYANYIYQIDEKFINEVKLSGTIHSICKQRLTLNGKLILDIMLNVVRENGSVDRIPLIFWNALAKKSFEKGQEISVIGRIQSRTYTKKEERTIVEVSVNTIC